MSESIPDPGSYHKRESFAKNCKNVNFGSKYKFIPKEGPGPGEYEHQNADHLTKLRSKNGKFNTGSRNSRYNKNDKTPPPGHYNTIKSIGADCKGIGMGSKYKWKTSDVPGPG